MTTHDDAGDGVTGEDRASRKKWPPARPMPLLWNVQQVGDATGISVRKLAGLVSAGDFPGPVKIGKLSRWRPRDVERWVDSLHPTGRN